MFTGISLVVVTGLLTCRFLTPILMAHSHIIKHFCYSQSQPKSKMLSAAFVRSSVTARYAFRTAPNNPTLLLRRAFATDSSHRPVIDLYGIHARYANAAYVAASKTNKLDQVESELLAIQETAAKSSAFRSFLENPLISRNEKERTITDMLKGKTSDVTLNLMTTLAGNARLAETTKIVDAYIKLMKAKRGEVEATIVSADPLTKAQTDAIMSAMKSQIIGGDNKNVVLSTKVDPSILGGLQVQIGDQFLDLSVRSRIDTVSRTVV